MWQREGSTARGGIQGGSTAWKRVTDLYPGVPRKPSCRGLAQLQNVLRAVLGVVCVPLRQALRQAFFQVLVEETEPAPDGKGPDLVEPSLLPGVAQKRVFAQVGEKARPLQDRPVSWDACPEVAPRQGPCPPGTTSVSPLSFRSSQSPAYSRQERVPGSWSFGCDTRLACSRQPQARPRAA